MADNGKLAKKRWGAAIRVFNVGKKVMMWARPFMVIMGEE
jgi:hypothetical protein